MKPDINAYPADWTPIRNRSDEEAVRQGYRFDPKLGNRPVRWIQRYCKLTTGKWAGKPFVLLEWQKDWLRRLFGWVYEDGSRRFTLSLASLPKKNGKSEMLSALALYLSRGEGEARSEIHLMAVDQTQAGILYKNAAHFVRASEDLSREFDCSDYHKRIKCPKTSGEIVTCSAEIDQKEGANLHAVIFDELHLFTGRRRRAWEVYSGAGAAREQSLRLAISTAGRDRDSVMFELVQQAHKIDSGEVIDVNFLGVVYGPKPGEKLDPHSEETWRRCNPSLGETLSIRKFRSDYEEAKISPSAFADWQQRRLNAWLDAGDGRLIASEDWAACDAPRRTLEEVVESGDPIYAGLDLSSTTDLTALVLVAGDNRKGLDVYCWAWIPEEEAERREKVNGIPYDRYRERGEITFTRGSRIDYDAVFAKVVELHERTGFRLIYADWFNAQLVNAEFLRHGIPFKQIRPGFISQNGPTKELERLVAEGLIRHDGNELLTWCISNAVAVRDGNGNVMISKGKSTHKIDPVAALINAIAGLVDGQVAAAKEPEPITDGKIIWRPYGGGGNKRGSERRWH
jgi:phage terminase large subunit-like protein